MTAGLASRPDPSARSGVTGSDLRPRILIVEDDAAQRAALNGLFAGEYDVAAAGNAADALALADRFRPDLVLVDLGLPDLDGIDLIHHLKVRGTTVLVITADATEDRMIAALDLGASDYVIKPFSAGVLRARVRRSLRVALDAHAWVEPEALEVGDVVIDLAAHQVFVEGRPLDLQARHLALLTVLARNAGRVVMYKAIAHALWDGVDAEANAQANLTSIRTAVTRLRAQLGDGPRRPVIETEPRVGYRLVVPGID